MGERERILLADDMEVLREGIKATFEVYEEGGHVVIGEAGSVEEVEALLDSGLKPTLAIVDGNMPNRGDGERAAELIRQRSPETKIISFSSDPQTWGDENWAKGSLRGKKLIDKVTNI